MYICIICFSYFFFLNKLNEQMVRKFDIIKDIDGNRETLKLTVKIIVL